MNIVLLEFHQESNSFNPNPYRMEDFERSGIYEGNEIRTAFADKPCALAGMMKAIEEAGATAIPGYAMFSQSGGPVLQSVVEHFITKAQSILQEHAPVDGVFLSLHGATVSTTDDDCSGYILKAIRQAVGETAVISVSTDLHANITRAMMKQADIICGYRTYPHQDHFETGYRAAKLGLSCLMDQVKPIMVRTTVPMIVPASTYSTLHGPFAELIEYGKRVEETGAILDFSIYQMQPWLDVEEAGSAVIVIAYDKEAAEQTAVDLAGRLFDLRHACVPHLHPIDDVIAIAEQVKDGKPVILVDSADSSNAGATGDSVAVVQRLLALKSNVKTAFIVADRPAADYAHRVGVGGKAIFSLGGSLYPEMNKPVQVEAYVKSLHDGVFTQEGPAGRGLVHRIGRSAVLQVGSIDILVCYHIAGNGDPQLYRAFGIEPSFYQLVVVKACTSYKAAYRLISDRIYEAKTPGAAGLDLKSLPFKRLPRSMYPFTDRDHCGPLEIVHARR
jgi:microcystin degradation protein MlrC